MARRISGLTAVFATLLGFAVAAETVAQGTAQKPPTAEEAKAFVDSAEQDLLKLWIDAGRADWVKSTYITDDTEVLAAQANAKAISARRAVRQEATRFDAVKVDAETARKLRLLKLSLTRRRARRPGRGGGADAPRGGDGGHVRQGQVLPARGQVPRPRGHHEDHGRRVARSEAAARRLGRLALDRAADRRRTSSATSSSPTRARASSASPTPARCGARSTTCRRTQFAAEVDRLWEQVRPLYVSLHAYVRWKLAREVRRRRCPASGPDPGPSARQHVGADLGQRLPARRPAGRRSRLRPDRRSSRRGRRTPAQMVRYGEGFFTLARLRRRCPKTFWERSLFTKPAGPRSGLPRERLGRRQRRRPPHQDVHRHHRRGLRHRPPRARPQLLPARLQQAARPLPRQRQRRLPRGDRRHHRAVDDARVPRQARPARRRARTRRRTSACCCRRRSRRSRSCRSAS